MSEKRRTPNPEVDEQELINQVHMRTMSGSMGFRTPSAPAAEIGVGQPPSSERSKNEKAEGDYDSTFLVSNVLDARKATYIGAEIHNLTKWAVDNVAPAGTSIGGYITRMMEQHYADNWERILAIYEAKQANKKTPLENASFIKHKEQQPLYEYIQYYCQPPDCRHPFRIHVRPSGLKVCRCVGQSEEIGKEHR